MAPVQPAVMPVPDVDPAPARDTAERLRRVGRLAGQALARLERTAPQGWSGSASEAYYGQRGRAAERADVLGAFARRVSTALDAYADDVTAALDGMRTCATDLDAALTRKAAALGDATPGAERAAQVEVDAVWARYEEHRRRYDLAVLDLGDALEALPEFDGRERDLWDHVGDAGRTFVQRAVAEPATAAAGLAAGLWDDPGSADDVIAGIVAGWLQQMRHPVATAKDAVGWQYWQDGQYGSGVGAAMSVVGGAAIRQALKRIDTPEHYEKNVANPAAPKPRVQTVDEMLAGVDLQAHEHYQLGHAIRRHVDVDDDYLIDRLENGTLLDTVKRGPRPPAASRWYDLETAEREITVLLQENERQVRRFAGQGGRGQLILKGQADGLAGTVMYPDGRGGLASEESRAIYLCLVRRDGQVYIGTAYLERKK